MKFKIARNEKKKKTKNNFVYFSFKFMANFEAQPV